MLKGLRWGQEGNGDEPAETQTEEHSGLCSGKDGLEHPKTQTGLVINPSRSLGSVSVMGYHKKSLCSHERDRNLW